jgi:hypothetical protein
MTTKRREGETPPAAVSKTRGRGQPIIYNGQQFADRTSLAHHVAAICGTGHSWEACRLYLRKHNNDVAAVLAELQRIATEGGGSRKHFTVNGRIYKTRAAFARHLSHYYGVSRVTAENWLTKKGLSPEEAQVRARQWEKQHKPVERPEPIWLFGWEFRSFCAVCAYYGHPYTEAQRRRWKEHLAAGKPAYEFFLETLTRLWQRDLLDDRNRYRREDLAHRPARSRPRNEKPYPILDLGEVRFVNAEQPPEADTFPRHCRNEVLRLRERVGQMGAS